MSKEKQIEEMAKTTCQMYRRDKEKKCAGVQECDMKCLHYQRCEALYNAGYRKQSDLTPCDVCIFNPPSSYDGKPCTVCPAQAKGE